MEDITWKQYYKHCNGLVTLLHKFDIFKILKVRLLLCRENERLLKTLVE